MDFKKIIQRIQSIPPEILAWGIFITAALAVFRPGFVTIFGIHDDFYFLMKPSSPGEPFYEAAHFHKTGRALWALISTIQDRFLNHTSDFIGSRVAAFALMIVFMELLHRFLSRRLKYDAWQRLLISLAIVSLPASQMFVLWPILFAPGFIALSLAMFSYLLLDGAWPLPLPMRIFVLMLSGIVFLCSLLTYQSSAVFVFACSFAVLVSANGENWDTKVRLILRDIGFYFAVMIIYAALNQFVLLASTGTREGVYEFKITTEVLSKAGLVWETFLTSLAGTWHLFFGLTGGIINAGMILAASVGLTGLKFKSVKAVRVLQGVGLGLALFLLANTPAFAAKGCWEVVGYRVLFPSSVMVLVVVFSLWSRWIVRAKTVRSKSVLKIILAVFVCLLIVTAVRNVRDVARNHGREYDFIRQQVLDAVFSSKNILVVNFLPPYNGENLIERPIPFEFNLMIPTAIFARFIIDEVLERARVPNLFSFSEVKEDIIFFDSYTQVIDFDRIRGVHAGEDERRKNKLSARLQTSAGPQEIVEVIRGGRFFAFHQVVDGKLNDFWTVGEGEANDPWLELDFGGQPVVIREFIFGLFGPTLEGMESARCRLHGSRDGEIWDEIPADGAPKDLSADTPQRYVLQRPAAYLKYRFYFESSVRPLRIASVFLEL